MQSGLESWKSKRKCDYVTFRYWKNSGMSASLTMGLFAATMPEAVLPCVVSLIVEAVWFAILTKYIDRMWPPVSEGNIDPEVPSSS